MTFQVSNDCGNQGPKYFLFFGGLFWKKKQEKKASVNLFTGAILGITGAL